MNTHIAKRSAAGNGRAPGGRVGGTEPPPILSAKVLDSEGLGGNGQPASAWSFLTFLESGQETLLESERRFREMIDALPAAIYTTDAEGRLTHFNQAAVEFSGRTPELGTDQWCVTWKLYYADGTPMAHDQCPMAIALKEGRIMQGVEAIAERPDGTRVWFTPYPMVLRDARGKIVGGINMLVDISERKRSEQVRARLAAIVESSDDAIISKDLNGVIMTWNQGAQRIFGYTAEEAVGRPVTLLMPPERLDEEPGILERIRRGEPIKHYETVRRRKDGTLVNISLTISPVVDSRGRIVGASKIARDITERKRAEEQLRNAERRFRGIVQQTNAGISQTDLSGRFVLVNDRFCEIVGRSREQLLGGPSMKDITHADDRQANLEHFQKLASGRGSDFVVEKRFVRPDGTIVWTNNSVSLVRNTAEGPEFVVAAVVDITERKRAEELRQQDLEDTRRLQSISAELIHQQNEQTVYEKILDASVAIMRSDMASMQMLYPERGVGGELRLLGFRGFDPEAAKFWEWVRADSACTCGVALRTGQRVICRDVANCEFMAGTADQATYVRAGIFAVQSTPLISRGGKLLGMISTHWRKPHEPSERELGLFDVLARQAADLIERKQVEERLEQTVAERTAKLREVVAELEHMSYAIIHDMRAPLRAMTGFAECLEQADGSLTEQQRRSYLRRISLAAVRLDQLIQDVLNYNRAVLEEAARRPVDLGILIGGILETYPNLGEDQVDIAVEGRLPVVIGNEALLTQCFSNLLSNAVKFVKPGVRPRVRMRAERGADASKVRIWVEDNGIGISERGKGRVFQMFQRLTASYEGTGIGLAIARKVVERMRGRIGVESQPEKGSQFWVELEAAGHDS